MLDPFVDGRDGVGRARRRRRSHSHPSAKPYPTKSRSPMPRCSKRRPCRPPSFEQRWSVWGGGYGGSNRTCGDPAVVGSHDLSARTAGFAGRPRLSGHAQHRRGLCARGRRHQLEPGEWPRRRQERCVPGRGLRRDALGPRLPGGGASPSPTTGCRPTASPSPATISPPTSTRSASARASRAAIASPPCSAGSRPMRRSRRRASARRPTARPMSTAAASRSAINARTATDTRSEFGARFDRLLALNPNAVLALRGRLAWAHDWVSDPTLAAVFQALPGASFIVNGADAGEELRADIGRRRASPRQRRLTPRQVRRRVRQPLLHLCRHRNHPLRLVKRRRRHRMDPPNTQPCNKNSARCAARSCRMILNCILAARDSRNTDKDKTYPRALTAFRPRGSGSTAAAARPAAGVT